MHSVQYVEFSDLFLEQERKSKTMLFNKISSDLQSAPLVFEKLYFSSEMEGGTSLHRSVSLGKCLDLETAV